MSEHNLKPMSEVINDLKGQGYDKDFIYRDNSLLTNDKKNKYQADDLTIVEEYRFEGDSNPSDLAILYAIKTSDGSKGTLVDSYGPETNLDIETFLKEAHNEAN